MKIHDPITHYKNKINEQFKLEDMHKFLSRYYGVVRCGVCKKSFIKRFPDFLRKQQCPYCAKQKLIEKRKKSFEEWVISFKEKHGDKYKYVNVFRENSTTYVEYVCPLHGNIKQNATSHRLGSKCPKCSLNRGVDFTIAVNEFNKIHNNKYYYLFSYKKNNKTQFVVLCPVHGIFDISYTNHKLGTGCPKCAHNRKKTQSEWIDVFRHVHKDKYEYVNVYYKEGKSFVTIFCPKHKETFIQTCNDHKNGAGCPKCAHNFQKSYTELVREAKVVHNSKYKYLFDFYKNNKRYFYINCPHHGVFYKSVYEHLKGSGCPKCVDKGKDLRYTLSDWVDIAVKNGVDINNYNIIKFSDDQYTTQVRVDVKCNKHNVVYSQLATSFVQGFVGCPKCNIKTKEQNNIADFLRNVGIDVVLNDRAILKPYEIDIFCPDYNIGIEYNGLYWHSEIFSSKRLTHIENKRKMAEEKGITIINIYEDDWLLKNDIVKSILLYKFGLIENNLYARKCVIKSIDSKTYKLFNIENHIMGHRNAKYKIGLYYDNALVAVAGFSDTELIRYTIKKYTSIVGGLGKITKWFIKNINSELITYVDLDYFNGNAYVKAGYEKIGYTYPKYWYYNRKLNIRESRQMYQKHKLEKLFSNFNPNLTEVQNCNNNGLYRIFGCSNLKLKYKCNK